jgi:hypothetical protein
MYFTSGLHGHGTSAAPSANGAPTVCMHGTNGALAPRTSTASRPIRVMIFMFTTT